MATILRYPPGPTSRVPGGHMLAFRRDAIGLLTSLVQRFGDVVQYRLGTEQITLINHPHFVRDVLVTNQRNFTKSRALQWAKFILGDGLLTSEGELHLRQRRLAQPAFQRQHLPTYGATMVTSAQRLQARWQDGEARDIDREMTRLTLAIASKTLFGADLEEDAYDIGEALTTIIELFPRFMLPFFELINKLPLPSNRRAEQARNRLDGVIYRIIQERRAGATDSGDLLSMLLAARDEEGDGQGMSDRQLRDELMTLLLAGHETTATLLTWTWYLLSQHPAVEAQLHAELASTLGGRLPTVEDMPQLPYTRMVIAETLRLYPPAWILGRRTIEPYDVGGYMLPAKAIVVMSPYLIQRDKRFFRRPEVFDPQRWTRAGELTMTKFSFFPFGAGARQCLGEGFAWMEGILALATLAQQWQMRLAPDQQVGLKPLITLRPKYGMRMVLQRRPAL